MKMHINSALDIDNDQYLNSLNIPILKQYYEVISYPEFFLVKINLTIIIVNVNMIIYY